MNYEECKIRSEIIHINSNKPTFYPYSININKCSGSCNNINDLCSKLCVPDVVKNINFKVFNLMSRTNETRNIKWHETCKCKCRLDTSVCNNKQRWNNDKCRCEFKELIDKGMCDKEFIWNPSICECECNKSCNFREYLDHVNCTCRKRLIDKVVEECTEDIDENEMIYNDYEKICSSCTVYIILFVIAFLMILGISSIYFYFHWYLKKSYSC